MNGELQPAAPRTAGPLIEARGITKSFGRTPALRGASVSVAAGEILAVMGPSGSGKSTLLHCLAGIFPPDDGEIIFDGQRLDQLSEAERTELRRTAFGFVFQFGQLVPELTAADNVALPLLLNRVRRRAAYEQALSWLARLGLEGKDGRRTGELSGGEAQRVAVARALAIKPKVLFADEPTGSLDSLTGEKVMDLLVGLTREEGTTVVLVTHDARVAAYAEREVVVRDGKVTTLTDAGVTLPMRGSADNVPVRPADVAARRAGGRDAARADHARGGDRRRAAAVRARRFSRLPGQQQPVVLGMHRDHGPGRAHAIRGATGHPARRAVELQRGLLPGPDDRAARRGRARPGGAGTAWRVPAARSRAVLRLPRAGRAAAHRARGRAG